MRIMIVPLIATTLWTILAPAFATPEADEIIVTRPAFDAERIPAKAVDHVTKRIVTPITGPPHEEHVTVARSGDLLRQDGIANGKRFSVHTDLKTATSVSIVRNGEKAYSSVTINRPDPDDTYNIFRIFKTGERDRAIGEECEVWGTIRASEDKHSSRSVWLTCVTSDGIELWTRIKHRSETVEYSRTVAIERRTISRRQLLPPRDALQVKAWVRRPEPTAIHDAAQEPWPVDHEVWLEGKASNLLPPFAITQIIRHRCSWRYSDTAPRRGERQLHISDPVSGFSFYYRELGGIPIGLQFYLNDPDPEQFSMSSAAPPQNLAADHRDPQQILGETCRWDRLGRLRSDIVVTSGYSAQCTTDDGVMLRSYNVAHRVNTVTDLVAVRLKRGSVRMEAVLPPSEVLDWRIWKINH